MAEQLRGASVREEFELARKCIWIFLVFNTIALASVVGVTLLGEGASTFMWVRALILVAVSPFLLWVARSAGAGSAGMVGRLRVVSTVLPVAVVVVDFIPGIAPVWYGVIQGLGALALIPVAVVSRRWARRLSAA
ncbi:hypothetical protein ACFWMR_04105 [Amycolatopsis thailandensis]|uniref:hypothetical protein n=1 Tax=Amycolatopsis thailandensis TaxID=589330 RepID=UPI003660595E